MRAHGSFHNSIVQVQDGIRATNSVSMDVALVEDCSKQNGIIYTK